VSVESRFGVRQEVGRDDADQERSQNRPATIQRLSLTNLSASPVVVIPLGKARAGSNAAQAPPPCPLPPPLAGNVVRFRIPVETIRQALLRKCAILNPIL
jgi:hypothetical protein